MAFVGNGIWYNKKLKGTTVNNPRPVSGVAAAAIGNTNSLVEVDPAVTSLVDAMVEQGSVRVDSEGTTEALTPGTVQTAATCSAITLVNDATAAVINLRVATVTGAILIGPITVEASKTRVIVFPTPLVATGGLYVQALTGALDSTPGYLIP